MVFQQHYDVLPNGAYLYYSDTIPNSAGTGITGRAGDFCFNTSTLSGQPTIWRCTAAGSPGTWEVSQQLGSYATAGGLNNAITVSLPQLSLVVGLEIKVNLGTLTLQNGANTLAFNGGTAKSILSHLNKASNIASAYSAGSIVPLIWDGTEWQDLSQ